MKKKELLIVTDLKGITLKEKGYILYDSVYIIFLK